jgi:putative phage-type endonuclease
MKRLEQGSPEWLELRRSKITGTDAAVILGLSPYKKPKKLFEQKLGIAPPDYVTPAMKEGTALEPQAVKAFEQQTGIVTNDAIMLHPEHEWMMGSFDGITFDGETILEVKCGKKSYEEALEQKIPPYYMAQIQHYLACSGAKRALYWAYRPDKPGVLIEVERDESFIRRMIEAEKRFKNALDERDISKIDEKPSVKAPKPLSEIDVWLHQYAALSQQLAPHEASASKIKEAREEIRKKIIAKLEEEGGESVRAHGVQVLRTTRKGSIRYNDIPELKDVDLEKYRDDEKIIFRIILEEEGK